MPCVRSECFGWFATKQLFGHVIGQNTTYSISTFELVDI